MRICGHVDKGHVGNEGRGVRAAGAVMAALG
jgi:hypothetical protein